ncbi:peptide/nickel transport system permease protein [Haloactinopolyspora alba]|uniref:Peptide/nickel transport system permease protein n=1 Tax=Haloactinopolyspora alba TaxID=648780 RepID=A0A2P8DVD5_9ACTN|nr:ABC transporter permease [Haloactinopolyspora alba]PSL01179.1 peptide/nickel transport system permease protein [Haloactinopolyspora alba]
MSAGERADTLPSTAPHRPRWVETLVLLARSPMAVASGLVLTAVVAAALLAGRISPHDPVEPSVDDRLQAPSGEHWFGTDELGRDVFSRVLAGAEVSLRVGAVAVGISLAAGVLIGLLAGYYRRWVDDVLMRVMDVVFAFPALLMAIAVLAILGRGSTNAMIAIGIVYTPIFARITRASVLSVREEVYVRAARSAGAGDVRIVARHVLPNVTAPIIVQTSVSLAFAILSEAALSFVGLGTQPPDPSWGRMLSEGRGFLEQAWWMAVFPGAAIFLTVLAFNVLGDVLRDVLDPRQRAAMKGTAKGSGG